MIGVMDCNCGNERLVIRPDGVVRCPVCTRAASDVSAWRDACLAELEGHNSFPGPGGSRPEVPPKRSGAART